MIKIDAGVHNTLKYSSRDEAKRQLNGFSTNQIKVMQFRVLSVEEAIVMESMES